MKKCFFILISTIFGKWKSNHFSPFFLKCWFLLIWLLFLIGLFSPLQFNKSNIIFDKRDHFSSKGRLRETLSLIKCIICVKWHYELQCLLPFNWIMMQKENKLGFVLLVVFFSSQLFCQKSKRRKVYTSYSNICSITRMTQNQVCLITIMFYNLISESYMQYNISSADSSGADPEEYRSLW